MASNSTDIRKSKALSYLLRHNAEKEGIQMRKGFNLVKKETKTF